MNLVISTHLNSPVTTVVFADQLAQLTPTSRQAKLAVIARALGLDLSAPLSQPERREPLRDDVPRRERSSVREVYRLFLIICRRLALRKYHPLARLCICAFGYSPYFAHAMVC